MRIQHFILSAVGVVALLAGCQKEPLSPADPLPFPMDANKDLTVAPGDDFFRYCNGGWLKTATLPEGKNITGGLHDASALNKQKKEALFQEDPVLKRIVADAEAALSKPEISRAYLDQLLEMIPDPAVTPLDDYFRLAGRLARLGVEDMLYTLLVSQNGRLYLDYIPTFLEGLLEDGKEVPKDPAGGHTTRFVQMVNEGLGIDFSRVFLPDEMIHNDVYAQCYTLKPEDVAQNLRDRIMKLERFVDHDGLKKVHPTWEVTNLVKHAKEAVPYYLDYVFVQKYVPAELKDRYTDVCKQIRARFVKRINSLDWMSGTTRSYALDKLDAMSAHVAYPDDWLEDTFPTLAQLEKCSCFMEEYLTLMAGQLAFSMELSGKEDEKYQIQKMMTQGSSISVVNAQYAIDLNSLVIYAGILLPPAIPEGVSEARTYAMFAVVGHEMTHGFDNKGSQYDKDGKEKNWWTVADKMAFEERQQLLVDCYNHLEVAPEEMPGTYCNGTVTLMENIADLGGVNLALDAYTEHLQQQGYFGSVLQAQQRKFFESYADIWCCLYGKEYIESKTTGKRPDVHALPRERVNGIVMNIDLWYDLYGVTRDNILYLPPERRTKIW